MPDHPSPEPVETDGVDRTGPVGAGDAVADLATDAQVGDDTPRDDTPRGQAPRDVLTGSAELAASMASAVSNGADDSNAGENTQVVPGGWKRAVLGLAVGIVAGAVVALLLPREKKSPNAVAPDRLATSGPVADTDAAAADDLLDEQG